MPDRAVTAWAAASSWSAITATDVAAELDRFVRQRNVLVTTYRRNGTRVTGGILDGEEAEHAAHRYPVMHGVLIPHAHHLSACTIHMEVRPR